MSDIYGLAETARTWRHKAAALAADVVARHAADVDTQACFPAESMAALAQEGFYGLCIDASFGGQGQGPATFAAVVEELARHCGSTAMVYVMHVAATKVIETSATLATRAEVLRAIGDGKHLTTLAISEKGSRSQFWAPVSQLVAQAGRYQAHAVKSWVTAAHHAARTGIELSSTFNGLGLRGNDSAPVQIEGVVVAPEELLTEQGKGLDCALQVAMPWFNVGTAAMAHGLCLATIDATARHLQSTGFEHTGTGLRDLPNLRARLAEMSVATEQSRALLGHTLREMAAPDEATPLWVLRTRMAALQTAIQVTDLAMKTCGGAAFSRHLGVERLFRDARAGWVMAPTVDHLADFIGRILTGLPLL
jgi:alkylation response protein AidB-like acyl-CoA dehydrogenase